MTEGPGQWWGLLPGFRQRQDPGIKLRSPALQADSKGRKNQPTTGILWSVEPSRSLGLMLQWKIECQSRDQIRTR